MATKLELVLQGVQSLSEAEKIKLREFLVLRENRRFMTEDALGKSLNVNMGPVATGCPCCGK
jgi:hypothetical protein